MNHRVAWCLTVLSVAVLAGCGPDRPETIRVRGSVTFEGGPPPAEGMVYFTPVEVGAGLPRRPGRGKFDADGRFSISSFSEGDGLVPGTYRVRLECWKTAPTMDTPGQSYVPEGYRPADVEVAGGGGAIDVPLDVPRAR